MKITPLFILDSAGVCAVLFLVVGVVSLYLGSRKTKHHDFREKGFLQPPSGLGWFHFLLFEQYEYFEDLTIRRCFGTCRACLIGGFFVIGAVILFFGSAYMLDGSKGISLIEDNAAKQDQQ